MNAEDTDVFKCNACHVVKHILEYSTIYCRQFLQGERRAHIWRCVECQFPKCQMCDARPDSPVMFNHVEPDGSWYCLLHRYPPCCVCRVVARPESAMTSKMKFKDWTCDTCKHSQKDLTKPSMSTTAGEPSVQPPKSRSVTKSDSAKPRNHHECQECFTWKPHTQFPKKDSRSLRRDQRCEACADLGDNIVYM